MFDKVVITAANAAQARGYREQIRWRKAHGMLPDGLDVRVVPDPKGERIGSLGATVNVLKRFSIRRGEKILICHSGGDARRTPGYAAMGKAFTPLPVEGRKALFDLILENMAQMPMPEEGGVLITCGDVLITFDFAAADLSRHGVTGFGYFDGASRAARHGVYEVLEQSRVEGRCIPVTGFLQKPKFKGGRHIIDTGIMWLDRPTAGRLAKSGWKRGDIYQEFTDALIRGFAPFCVNVAKSCDFFHIGSSRELLACMTRRSATSRRYGFSVKSENRVWGDVFSSARECIMTCIPEEFRGEAGPSPGRCLTYLPIGERDWVKIEYGIDDNFKEDGKWERPLFLLGGRRASLKELMPLVNHKRLLAVYA